MSEEKDINVLKEQLAALAVQVAREGFGLYLDYSPGSVRHVEEVLAEAHEDYRRTQDSEGINGLALEVAAYMIKVIEKNYGGGAWQKDHAAYGSETFAYEWRGNEFFLYHWCLKRITDGPGENVWLKFRTQIISRA